ncbi:MAG: hypothetical protein ACFB6S_04310 [Geminicoccaceae bacterium]
MPETVKSLSTDHLRSLIDQTEGTLSELKGELDRRDELAQHQEIDKLETHMKNAELSLQTIRDFLAYLLEGRRSGKG